MEAEHSNTPLHQAAQSALDIQNAVNLSGVVRFLSEIVDVLRSEARKQGHGTKYVNAHPIVTLFLAKLVSLNNSDCFCSACVAKYGHATAEVEKIAGGLNDETNGSGAL
jgi:hypothetical protein